MSIIAVIPARSGSKRVPDKNMQPLKGKPLLQYTVECAVAAGCFDRILVSTDSERYAQAAKGWGAEVVMRPDQMSQDASSTEDVVLHVLDSLDQDPEWVCTLQPTSPFRTPENIRAVMDKASAGDADVVFTVSKEYSDFWQTAEDGTLVRLFPDAPRRQQERTPLLVENSSVYCNRTSSVRALKKMYLGKVEGVEVSPQEGFDINTAEDLRYAAFLMGASAAD